MPPSTFAEALQRTRDAPKRHLMLGNGFSRALRDDIFAYGALFDRADFGDCRRLRAKRSTRWIPATSRL